MRTQTREYLSQFLPKHPELVKCLDVGSMEIMGGQIRDLFEGREYTGLDMREGGNVDLVLNAHDIQEHFQPETFDLVTCFDTLEHDDAFWITVENMRWVLKPGGWLFIGVPSRYCPEHDHPHDYWRFMPQIMKDIFLKDYLHLEVIVDKGATNAEFEDEIYGFAQKP